MNILKSLWSSVQGDPAFMRRANGWLTVFWVIMIPISIWTGWVESVVYVSALSLWALVSGHLSAWQAARVEVRQNEIEEERQDKEHEKMETLERIEKEELQTLRHIADQHRNCKDSRLDT